ncbi:MAG: methyltransferase domain-containing protein [Myxococcales bacterium]|nr:methyltransferase domain-containing protein [Myxococcales bacterium]
MAEAVDYFSNHRLKLRFPWRLYHGPIINALDYEVPGPRILNLGSGPFFELDSIDAAGKELTLADIDPRAMELAQKIHGARIAHTDVLVPGEPLPYPDGHFDGLVSMDVIEHLPEPEPWLREAFRVVRPGGLVFLTTPNYASRSLVVIELTALEAIARVQGFSRKALHPSKLDAKKLRALLHKVDARRERLETIAFGWVLTARATKA